MACLLGQLTRILVLVRVAEDHCSLRDYWRRVVIVAELEHYTGLYDYIILGAGPAGLQLAYFRSKGLHRYVVMERADRPGSFFLEMPRSRTLISFNKVHSLYCDPELRLRWDWNSLLTDNYELLFGKFSKRFYPRASEFMSYLDAFARRNELNIAYNKTINRCASRERWSLCPGGRRRADASCPLPDCGDRNAAAVHPSGRTNRAGGGSVKLI
jgi:hypothetical protein